MTECWAFTITYAAQIQNVEAAPRARGALRLAAKRRDAATVIGDLRQEGSLKALFPQTGGDALQAVFLNTAGGLTGGDRMMIDVTAEASAHVVMSSQAAERAYMAQPGQVARTELCLKACAAARIDWIPQETILFEGAALNRRLRVDLAQDAKALIVETLVFGRAAMGEKLRDLRFTDQWRVYRDGRLVFADAVRLMGDAQALLQRQAIGGDAGAMATVLFAGPGATQSLQLPDTVGVSRITDDLLLLRFLAADSFTLRRDLIPVVEALTDAPMPRVWRL
ncbi:urease accessory protein UreD [Yoonia sp. R2-816]|uniref:urease accessory protein UreD n=1 Tax=Yoonia sp. R2-816 TaxID=3342638 RepID=UPI00372D0E8D